jgi:hypothetical protein
MFIDHESHLTLTRERVAQLQRDMQLSAHRNGRARRLPGTWLVRLRARPAVERRRDCREVSSRA